MTPTIRPLDPATDATRVDAFWPDAADDIRLERDEDPHPGLTLEFFTDAPPGCAPGRKFGLFDGPRLVGIADLAFGYPGPSDAYLGLLILAAQTRGRGFGHHFLRALEAEARARHAPALYLAVLDANPRGRAFWEREGFTLHEADRRVTLGPKTQTACRMVKALT
jgi:GNAT superfamily N-acetyltransferase